MTPVYLRLLGRPRVEFAGASMGLPPERRCKLLMLLAMRRGWMARRDLAALLWPGQRPDLASTNLRKALHHARAMPWVAALESQGSAVRFVVATDLQDVEQAMREGCVAEALQHCRGELLDGMDDASNAAWTDWLDAERAQQARRWHELTRARLEQLQAEPREAAALARRLLDADPLDEDAVVALLGAQRELGAFAEQREAYRSFAMRLDEELGVEPSLRVSQLLRDAVPRVAGPVAAASDGFIGRAHEFGELAALLALDECRLLTITGPGGVGKSSLMKHALRQLAPRFPGGVLWIALDDLSDITQVVARIAAELKVAPAPQQDPLQFVCEQLKPKALLLVLDNSEHLCELARLIERLLGAAPALKVCATSRARLGVRGEWLLPLPGLALPPARAGPGEVLASDAAQLLVAAATMVQPGFDARAQAPAIGALVEAVGGLPLAILLAAHWVRLLPVAEIVGELERSLDVLDSGDDEGEERPEHRSMQATFERSWQMLAAREQRTLATLSVFVGPFSRAAARDVTGAALPLLAALADKSLTQMPAGGRCSLHPLIRQFAGEKLDADARAGAVRRHAQWFHRLLARVGPAAEAGDQRTLDEIGDELENCRQAWRWAIDAAATDQIAGSVAALKQFFSVRGRVVEGIELLMEARPVAIGAPACGAQLASAIAQLQYRVSRLDEAAASARQGIRLAREAGHRIALIRCLSVLGTCCWQWGRNDEAKRYLDQALRHAHAGSDVRGAAMAQGNLALVEKALGNYARARSMTLDWLSAQREQGEWLRVAVGLNNLAYICVAQGAWDEARGYLDEGLELCERHDLSLPRPSLLVNLANVHAGTGRFDDAEHLCRQVVAGAREKAFADVEAAALNQLVRVAIRRGDGAAARVRLHEAAGSAAMTRNEDVQLDSVFCFARILASEGNGREAAPLLRFYLSRPHLEPVDRAEAEACLARLPADSAATKPVEMSLGALLQHLLDQTAARGDR